MKKMSVLMAMLLVFAMLAACAGTPSLPGTENNPSGGTTAGSTTAAVEPDSSGTRAANGHEPVTLKIWGGDLLNNQDFQNLMKAKYPWMDYEVVQADEVKLMSMVAANNAPDIWILSAFHMGCMYAARGLYAPLDDYIAKSKVFDPNGFEEIQKLFMFDGKEIGKGATYGIVKDWSLDTQLFINKKVFADAGIALPDPLTPCTWDDVRTWAKAMVKKNGDKQTRWGLGTTNNMSQRVTFQLAQLGSSMYSADLKKANIDTPEMKQVLEYWADLFKTGAAISPLSTPGDWGGDSFAKDDVGMLMLGYWFGAQLKLTDASKDHLDDYMLIQSPVYDKSKPMNSCLAGVGGSIYSGSKHKDEAFQLLELYLGGKFAEDRTKLGWGIPAIKEYRSLMPQGTSFEKQIYQANDKGLESLVPLVTSPFINAGGVEATFNKYFNEVIYGRMDMDSAIKAMQKDYDIMIQEGMEIIGVK